MSGELTGDKVGWSAPPGIPAMPEDEVHVWRAEVSRWSRRTEALGAILSAEERTSAERFRFEVDRTRSLVGRGLLRLLLARYAGKRPSELQFDQSASGKPRLIADTDGNRLQFSVSHSGDLILIAVASGRAVGIDVEQIRPGAVAEQVARSFSPWEQDALSGLQPPLLQDAFFACWTRKEAYIKARGDGLSLPLDSFDVTALPGERAQLLATRPDAADAGRWTLRDLDVGPGYKAALAVEGSDWRLKTWDVPPLPAI